MSKYLKEKKENLNQIEKGKKKGGDLSISKSNKMNASSVNQSDFEEKNTFPMIIRTYNDDKQNYLRS